MRERPPGTCRDWAEEHVTDAEKWQRGMRRIRRGFRL